MNNYSAHLLICLIFSYNIYSVQNNDVDDFTNYCASLEDITKKPSLDEFDDNKFEEFEDTFQCPDPNAIYFKMNGSTRLYQPIVNNTKALHRDVLQNLSFESFMLLYLQALVGRIENLNKHNTILMKIAHEFERRLSTTPILPPDLDTLKYHKQALRELLNISNIPYMPYGIVSPDDLLPTLSDWQLIGYATPLREAIFKNNFLRELIEQRMQSAQINNRPAYEILKLIIHKIHINYDL